MIPDLVMVLRSYGLKGLKKLKQAFRLRAKAQGAKEV